MEFAQLYWETVNSSEPLLDLNATEYSEWDVKRGEKEKLTHYFRNYGMRQINSIVAQGIGVNITVQSYVDQVYLGLTTCAKAVPDADLLRDDLIAAFEELKARLLPQNLAELKPKAAAPVASANQESNSEVAVKVA